MKEYLSRKGVAYTEYNVAQDTHAREEMLAETGRLAVPTIMVDDQVVIGFDEERLNQLLGK